MSLSSFLQVKEVRGKFNEMINYPKLKRTLEIKAPPITRHYSLIGTAFDYLLRFRLELLNQNVNKKTWVAYRGYDKIKDESLHQQYMDATNIIEEAEKIYGQYINGLQVVPELLKASLSLAKLDIYFRSGVLDSDLKAVEQGDIEDLRNLYGIINPAEWVAKERCILNPTFGAASTYIGGADADILLDKMLIEVKTVQGFDSYKQFINQLVGYYILNRQDSCQSTGVNIQKVGLYFSRYASMQVFSIDEIITDKKVDELGKWMKEFSAGYSMQRIKINENEISNNKLHGKASGFTEYENYCIPYIYGLEKELYEKYYKKLFMIASLGNRKEFDDEFENIFKNLLEAHGEENIKIITAAGFLTLIKKYGEVQAMFFNKHFPTINDKQVSENE